MTILDSLFQHPAVRNRKGVELEKTLPLLAAYLGNLDLLGMQRYVALSPCSFQSQLERLKI